MLVGPLPIAQARLLKALGHPVRLRIAVSLLVQACTVGEIWSRLGLSQAEVSRHLALLRKAGAVNCSRQGKQVRYCLRDKRVRQLIRALASPGD